MAQLSAVKVDISVYSDYKKILEEYKKDLRNALALAEEGKDVNINYGRKGQ